MTVWVAVRREVIVGLVGTAVAAAVAMVGIGAIVATDDDPSPAADPVVDPSSTIDEAVPSGPLTVAIAAAVDLGPLSVTTGPITAQASDQLVHTLHFTNGSNATVHLNDTRRSAAIAPPPAIVVGSPGCGYAVAPGGHMEAGACRSNFVPHTIEPGQTLDYDLTIYTGAPGVITVMEGGEFVLPIEWRVDRPFAPQDDVTAPEVFSGAVTLDYTPKPR